MKIDFRTLQPTDQKAFQFIADWYLDEWKIPQEQTIQRLESITTDSSQLQVLMTINDSPVATAGIYNHVSLLDKVPRLKIYPNWLALVYIIPKERHKGYGALICDYIQDLSRKSGLDTIYLFTHTAEQLYKRLGWIEIERLNFGDRNIVIMKKDLLND